MKYEVGDEILIPSRPQYLGKILYIDSKMISVLWKGWKENYNYSPDGFKSYLKRKYFVIKNIDLNLVCKKKVGVNNV